MYPSAVQKGKPVAKRSHANWKNAAGKRPASISRGRPDYFWSLRNSPGGFRGYSAMKVVKNFRLTSLLRFVVRRSFSSNALLASSRCASVYWDFFRARRAGLTARLVAWCSVAAAPFIRPLPRSASVFAQTGPGTYDSVDVFLAVIHLFFQLCDQRPSRRGGGGGEILAALAPFVVMSLLQNGRSDPLEIRS